jgi:hypothetical protein
MITAVVSAARRLRAIARGALASVELHAIRAALLPWMS